MSCSNNSKTSLEKGAIISEEKAKEIVANDIIESEYYQQYYVKSSPKFDERVMDITWGKTILITIIPDGKLYKSIDKYYLITGILPDGQVLAAQTVNAYTGKLMDGAILTDKEADILRIATEEECSRYLSDNNYSVKNMEAIFHYDGTFFSVDPIYSWKYCVNINNSRSLNSKISNLEDYIFIDPWINKNVIKSNELNKYNGYFSKLNYNHRLYKLENTLSLDRNFTEEFSSVKFICID